MRLSNLREEKSMRHLLLKPATIVMTLVLLASTEVWDTRLQAGC